MHVHFIGVSGTLMGSVAGLVRAAGQRVTGSDTQFYEPMGSALKQWGVECHVGYQAQHLLPAPDLVVVGNVCRADNPEVLAALAAGLETVHVAQAIQRFALQRTRPLVVAGTHGKTTTAALAAHLLEHTGRRPGFLIGGIPKNFGVSFRQAHASLRVASECSPAPSQAALRLPPFVIEGDEYDTAFFEKTPKFLHYTPQVAIITSIEHDHIDIYPSMTEYTNCFERFIRTLPDAGLLVAHAGDATIARLGVAAPCEVSWFALADEEPALQAPLWIAAPGLVSPRGTEFDVYAGGSWMGRWLLPAFGRHNLKNALAACIACIQGFGVKADDVAAALSRFQGVKRRQDLLGTAAGISVYDDFAHHPTAVRETLAGLHAGHPDRRIVAVFEPKSATACRQIHQAAYADAFAAADVVYLAPVARTNIPPAERLDIGLLAAELERRGKTSHIVVTLDEMVAQLLSQSRRGDVIVFLSNGDLSVFQERLLAGLVS